MVIIFQHVPTEGPGLIADMLEGRGIPFAVVEAHEEDPFPLSTAGYTAVISMGGPMSANDDLPFIHREREFLAEAAGRGIPVLGICLGAQILAAALGSRVYPGTVNEVGWGEVQLTPDGEVDRILGGLDSSLPVLHWHSETFDLPRDAVLLTSTPDYLHQAFRWGENAYGLQFHLEVNEGMVRDWLEEDGGDASSMVEDHHAILSAAREHLPKISLTGSIVFGRFLDLLMRGPARTGGPDEIH